MTNAISGCDSGSGHHERLELGTGFLCFQMIANSFLGGAYRERVGCSCLSSSQVPSVPPPS
jgi:hypothetical protein